MTIAAALRAALHWICRAAIGLLLALAAATPSLAEVGCFEDAVRHSQEAAANAGDVAVQAPVENGGERGSTPDRATHCSFGHCPHWVPVAAPDRAGQAMDYGEAAYPPFLALALAQSVQGGPERPPRL